MKSEPPGRLNAVPGACLRHLLSRSYRLQYPATAAVVVQLATGAVCQSALPHIQKTEPPPAVMAPL